MAPIDPHSYADSTQPFATDVSLSLYFDFPASTLHASALLSLPQPFAGTLVLDTRHLYVHSVTDPASDSPLPFTISPPHSALGSRLSISIPTASSSVLVTYSTSPSSSALQWLSPPQTTLGKSPFVYTQCQAIHARAVFPCQDTPAARIRYSARLNIPAGLAAVMSARHVGRHPPFRGEAPGIPIWDEELEGRVVEEFIMDQPIPPYLFAFAVGELGWREVGPRTRVYAEDDAGLLEEAAREFAGAEGMIREGERLFGEYEWERFDLLVLPRSFPYGGMENPRMVFLTPTVIKGDGSGAQVVAHELAHSWTGNLITNKNNEHFWLNEVTDNDSPYCDNVRFLLLI